MFHTSFGETYSLPDDPDARRYCYTMIQRIGRSKLVIRDIEQEQDGSTNADKSGINEHRKGDWVNAVATIVRSRIALRHYGALP